MNVFLSEMWKVLQNYTYLSLGEQHKVIIEQVEPPTSQVNLLQPESNKSRFILNNLLPPAESLQIPNGRQQREADTASCSFRPDCRLCIYKSQLLHVPGCQGHFHDNRRPHRLLHGRGEVRVAARACYPGIELNAIEFL